MANNRWEQFSDAEVDELLYGLGRRKDTGWGPSDQSLQLEKELKEEVGKRQSRILDEEMINGRQLT
jgi:hypothetical protein